MGDALANLGPNLEEQVKAFLHGRVLTGKSQPENSFRIIACEELEAGRGGGILFGQQRLGKSRSQRIQIVPLLDKTGAQHQLLQGNQLFASQLGGKQLHLRGRNVDGQVVQRHKSRLVGLGRDPSRKQNRHPALGFKRPQDLQRLLFVADFLQFPLARLFGKVFDYAFLPGIQVAGAGLGIHLPTQAHAVARGANHQGWFFKETVVGDHAQRS